MNYDLLFVFILWMLTITSVTVLSVHIIKKYPVYGFTTLTALYVAYLLSSQVIATRLSVYDFGTWFGHPLIFFAPAAAIIYSFISQVLDMINEIYGRKKAVAAIIIALATQVLFVIFIALAIKIPAAPYFELEEAWVSLFGLIPGIIFASWIAFLICSLLDAYMFAYIKRKFKPKELAFKGNTFLNPYIWLRSLVTDAFSLALDSIIFIIIAFYFVGALPWEIVSGMIVGQIVVKVFFGVADTPWFVLYKKMLGKTGIHSQDQADGQSI